jgi:hypothetical protein
MATCFAMASCQLGRGFSGHRRDCLCYTEGNLSTRLTTIRAKYVTNPAVANVIL